MPAFFNQFALPKHRRPLLARVHSQKRRKLFLEGLEDRLAMTIDGLAVAGDSWSDEYAAESYNYARNWAELLVSQRGIDLGAPGNYTTGNDNRGANGTAFNWAQVNTSTVDLLLQLQDISITDQYTNGDISHVVLMIGMSEFAPGSEAFTKIADGTWPQTTIDSNLAFSAAAVRSALAVLMGVPLKGLVTTIPDPTMTPQGKTLFDATGRAKVRSAVDFMNTEIKKHAAEYHVPVVDLAALQNQILGTPSTPKNSITIGGNIYTATAGEPKSNLFINGGVLPHTVYQALVANAIIEGLNFAYNENIPRITEQQIVALAGQTYVSDSNPINYSGLVTAPPVTVYLSYGTTGTPSDDFTARVSEWATARGISQLTPDSGGNPGELTTLKNNILNRLRTAFAGTAVNFTGEQPADTRFEAIKLGVLSDGVPGALTSRIGQSSFDWLNSSEQSTGYVFVDLITRNDPVKPNFDNINLATLSRADQLRFLENALTFYIGNEVGRGMGLQAADAYGYSSINSSNAANTGGVQFLDFMSGDPALGFNTASFNGAITFTYSPLARAKLQYGHWLTQPTLATIAESASAHNTTGTAQTLNLVSSIVGAQRVGLVRGANISVGSQVDMYKITAAAGDKITAQTLAAGVYGAPIDTNIRILAADGTTVLASSDNTLLGNNSIGQAGTTTVSTDSLVLNYVVATAGDIFIEVTAKNSGTGNYDLMVTNTVVNQFPWHNIANPLNVTGNTTGTAITAFDVVPVINQLNLFPTGLTLPVPSASFEPPPYLDVSPDGKVTAFDAIPIINYLNLNPLGGPGTGGGEFVPFAQESAGEATAPETLTAPAEEAGLTSRSAGSTGSSSGTATALPYQSNHTTPSLLFTQPMRRAASNFASNPLTWLLLAPQSTAAGEATEDEGSCASSEEHAAALEALLTEEE